MPADAITPDQLLRLNDEIALLARAGVPLERGLRDIRGGLPRRLQDLVDRLVDRLESGQSLEAAIQAEQERFPPLYAAVIRAGSQSGRLTDALHAYSGHVQTYLTFRDAFWRALTYPTIVVAVAWCLAVLFAVFFVPTIIEAADWVEGPPSMAVTFAKAAHETVWIWGWLIPLILVALLWSVWSSSRAAFLSLPARGEAPRGSFSARIPGLSWMLKQIEISRFLEFLALLLEHRLPLHESVATAGQLSGNRGIARATDEAARKLAAGRTPGEVFPETAELPRIVRWMLSTPLDEPPLEVGLRQLADLYQRRAAVSLGLFRVVFPVVATILLGGGAALAYALLVYLPLQEILRGVLQR